MTSNHVFFFGGGVKSNGQDTDLQPVFTFIPAGTHRNAVPVSGKHFGPEWRW